MQGDQSLRRSIYDASAIPSKADLTAQYDLITRVGRRLPEVYLVLALVLAGLLCVLTAPFGTPDEAHHAARAISLSHGVWMARPGAGEYGAEIDANALRVMDGMDAIRMEWETGAGYFLDRRHGSVPEKLQRRYGEVRWAGRLAFATFPNTAVYPPVLYLPAMLGWRVGESAGLTIFQSLRLARLLCAVTAVVLGWMALRVCPVGARWLLIGFLMLPSTLFLNASCSQDAVLLAVAGLLMALISSALVQRREFRGWELVVVGLLLTICGTARPPYLGLGLLVFLPSLELGVTRRIWIGPGAVFVGVVSVGVWWRSVVTAVGFDAADWASPEKQVGYLREHFGVGMWTVLKGTAAGAVDLFSRGLYVMGWNDLLAGRWARVVLVLCLGAMVVFAPVCPVRTWAGRGLVAVAVGSSLVGISLAEYVIWTTPGGTTLYGVQPRYWLPVLPLGMLLVRSLTGGSVHRLASRTRGWIVLGATGTLGVMACTLPWMAAEAFYRESVAEVFRLNVR